MSGAGWLNLGSLVLGLVAWILPGISLMQHKEASRRNWAAFSIASVSACAVSLCMQIFYTDHLVTSEDWSALLDTSHVLVVVATILLAGTLILNAITLVVYGKKGKD